MPDEVLRAPLRVGERLIDVLSRATRGARLDSALEMAGALCHEINQPLQVAMGNAELLAYSVGEEDPAYEFVGEIRHAVERIGDLTRKLMNLTRYETMPYLGIERSIVDLERSSSS